MAISLTTIEERVTNPVLEHMSYSRFATFTSCPESYRRKYVLGHRAAPSEPLATGSMTHAIIGAYYELLMKKPRMAKSEREQTSLDAAGDVLVGIVDDARRNDQPVAFTRDIEDVEEEAVRLGKTYIDNHPRHVKPLAVERKISVDLGNDLPPLIGYIDVEAETSLIEIKTSSRSVSQPSGAWIMQGLVYQSAIPKPVEYHVLVKTKEPKLLTSSALSLPYDADRVSLALDAIRSTARRILDLTSTIGPDAPWPMLGVQHPWACSMCDSRSSCPLGGAA